MKPGRLHNALFNGRYLTRPATGVDRFANELLAAVASRHASTVLSMAVPSGTSVQNAAAAPPHALLAAGRFQGHAWEQLDLPRLARARPLVNLCNTAPLWRQQQLVVVHDVGTVANAANYSLAFRSWYRLMHSAVMRRARVVATVSRFSADELAREYGKRPQGIEVISEGGEHILRAAADNSVLDRLQLNGRRYVLAVGTRSPNKNFQAVLRAVQLLGDPDLLLVAAGGGNARVFTETALEDPCLRFTGYVSDGQLRALYENAACFAFPSYYEGFGLPPLEAMCCGCPVIVSDRASLPEVCGDAALYCQAEDPTTLATALRRLLGSPSLQHELRLAGRGRASHFGWHKAAQHFEQVFDAHFA